MDARLLVALLLLAGSTIGCSGSSGTPSPGGTFGSGVNGIHTGEIWIAERSGSKRFNLQTGQTVRISDDYVFPSRDGSVYVEYKDEDGKVKNEDCDLISLTTRTINIKKSRNGETLSSFRLFSDVNTPVRLSPDGQRIAMKVADAVNGCGDDNENHRVSVYSPTGEQLYRNFDNSIVKFDWHPDGRLIVLQRVDGGYLINMESAPGSYEFTVLLQSFIAPPGVRYYTGFRVGPTGNDAVLEAVIDEPISLATVESRDAKVHHFPLDEDKPGVFEETNLFEHGDDKPRVNGPAFSPDGQHILVTEGFSRGGIVVEHPTLLDVTEFIIIPRGNSASYIVPVDTRLQPMPPEKSTETIRPILKRTNDGFEIERFPPLVDLTWTPAVD